MELTLSEFLLTDGPIYDVRSPGEFAHGTIPGALNLPLFSDAERAAVGTCYKQVGPQEAYLLGLKFVGPKLYDLANTPLLTKKKPSIFCWRGGMRSRSVSWLLANSGMQPALLQGGYKAFRSYALELLAKPLQLQVISGLTGSGKTALLRSLHEKGEQVIDLEALANHRGSSFGGLGLQSQPSNESFENNLAFCIRNYDLQKTIFVEDESRMIGTCKIPDFFYRQMQTAPREIVNTPKEIRIESLVAEYGVHPPEQLIEATKRLQKKLGSERTLNIIKAIQEKNLHQAVLLLLDYYDKAYHHSRANLTLASSFP